MLNYSVMLSVMFLLFPNMTLAKEEKTIHRTNMMTTHEKDAKSFIEDTIERLKIVLMNSNSTYDDKLVELKKLFASHFDVEYIKKLAVSRIIKAKKINEPKLGETKDAIMEFLFRKYINLTSEHKNVETSIRKITDRKGYITAICDITTHGGRQKISTQISIVKKTNAIVTATTIPTTIKIIFLFICTSFSTVTVLSLFF